MAIRGRLAGCSHRCQRPQQGNAIGGGRGQGGAKFPERLPRISHTWNAGRVKARGKLECQPRTCSTRGLEFHGGQNAPPLRCVPHTKFQYMLDSFSESSKTLASSEYSPRCLCFIPQRRSILVPGRKAVRQRTGHRREASSMSGPEP